MFKEGDILIVTNSDGHHIFSKGETVELVELDEEDQRYPYFVRLTKDPEQDDWLKEGDVVMARNLD